jgi:WD40 repeat protein
LEATRFVEFFGYSPDGTTLHALSGYQAPGAALYWLDATTLEEVHPRTDPIGEGTLTAMALSPDGTKLATGAQDGFVRIWDALTGRLVHEITMGAAEVLGVTFITDTHVAVVPTDGNLRLLTIDNDELLQIVRESLTRGFTEAECVRFNFFDSCPTLAELRRE